MIVDGGRTPAWEEGVVCVSPQGCDKLRVYNICDSDIHQLTSAISDTWHRGIQRSEWCADKVYEFKLRGNPWQGEGSDAVAVRRLAIGVFRCMLRMGYGLAVTTFMSKKPETKDAWVFLRGSASNSWQGEPRHVFAISFNKRNTIRVIDGEETAVAVVTQRIQQHWPKGIKNIGEYEGVPEIKLRGSPWTGCRNRESMGSRVLVSHLVAGLAEAGYTVYASVALTSKNRGDNDHPDFDQMDSWIVIKTKATS